MNSPVFIPLRIHTAFSLLEGANRIDELVNTAVAQRVPAMAMCDSGNIFGAMEFSAQCAAKGVQPIIGCQLNIGLSKAADDVAKKLRPGHKGAPEPAVLPVFVQNHTGYMNLIKLISKAFMETEPLETPHIKLADLHGHSEGLIALSGGARGVAGRYLLENRETDANDVTKELAGLFDGRFYMEIMRHGLPEEVRTEDKFIDLAYKLDIPLVATNEAYYPSRDMHEAHDALICIKEGAYVIEDDRRKVTKNNYLKTPAEMAELFADLPEALANSEVIAKRTGFYLEHVEPILPPYECKEGETEADVLRRKTVEGLNKRLENHVFTENMNGEEREKVAKPYFERMDYELGIIGQMGFPGYFLIVSDFIQWSKDNGVPVGPGRGSGAGSVVAWSLTITDLDPLHFGLLFERFLNPERVSMPDFDIDFCQEKRIQAIEYVQNKYGHDRVAQIITFGKLQARAVIRDVGRVLQMPYGQVDRICKMIPNEPGKQVGLSDALKQEPELAIELKNDATVKRLFDIAMKLEGLYRNSSTHAAGVVIGDKPLNEIVALYRDPKSDMPVTQFDMKWVESAGLIKFDFLGLKTLTVLDKAVHNIGKSEDGKPAIDLSALPLNDAKTYELLGRAETAGVFQLESDGMRDILRQLKPDTLEEIIAIVSLYRPGPMDNIPSYINRKFGVEKPDYLHHTLEPILKETYGIMIYQEQVMQIAQVLGGYSLGEADILRRAMGKKKVEVMAEHKAVFIKGAKERGVKEAQAANIFDQMAKFAGYGFNKSHAAAYALIAYQTAYMKAHYPVEFMAAIMTLDLDNTDKLSFFAEELKRMKIDLLPPDVNKSDVLFTVENGAVRYALGAIKNVGRANVKSVVDERMLNGKFTEISDFVRRLDNKSINRRQLENLIKAGALDSIVPNRAKLLNSVEMLLQHAATAASDRASSQNSLFGDEVLNRDIELPEKPEFPALEKLELEAQAVGFFLSAHPLDSYANVMGKLRVVSSADLVRNSIGSLKNGQAKLAGIVNTIRKMTSKKGNRFTIVQFSDSTGIFEVMFFGDIYNIYKDLLEENVPFLVKVAVNKRPDSDELRLNAVHLEKLDKAAASHANGLIVTYTDTTCLPKIADLLKAEQTGKNVVYLHPVIPGWKVEIALQKRYNITGKTMQALRSMPGISNVREL